MIKTLIITGLLCFTSILFPQRKLTFDFDFAQFAYDSSSNYLEIYYSLSKRELTAVERENGKVVEALLKIKIKNADSGEFIVNKYWMISQPYSFTDSSDAQTLMGVLGFQIPEGKYSFFIKAVDKNDTLFTKSFNTEFKITPFISKSIKISYIQLAKKIIKADENSKSIFYKNTYEVIPNPSLLYNKVLPVVFFYDELYNLSNTQDTIIVERSLYNNQGLKIFSRKKTMAPSTTSIVDVGMINMIKYPTDVYNLVITIQDTAAKNGALASKRFFYYNPELIDSTINNLTQRDYIASEFGVMNVDELDLLFDQCKYIASSEEIDRYEKLTSISGKREFLYNFWKKRDPNPATRRNEFKEEYMKRINFVERRFAVMNKRGYQTDRGRVYLILGEWDQIDRFPNPTNRKPYEIWYYNSVEGGVIFVFADLTGYNDYELLHSTMRGEIKDYRWQNRIIQN